MASVTSALLATDTPDATAARIAALSAAVGASSLEDWAAALEHLRRAAKLGSRMALAELAALAGNWEAAHRLLAGEALPPSCGDPVSASIDLAKWLQPPLQRTTLSESPRVVAVGDMVSAEFCDWVLARSREKLKRASVSNRRTGQRHIISHGRTNSDCDFRGAEADLVLALLRARIAALTGTQVARFESVHVFHYGVGQEFLPHLDATLDASAADYPVRYAAGHQRVLTFLLALNDDFEGGQTAFPQIGLRWKPRRGRALFFWNVEPGGAIDQRALHAGRPVTRGEKWMLSQWIAGQRPQD
jgi:prolyl 4-hydroxylase